MTKNDLLWFSGFNPKFNLLKVFILFILYLKSVHPRTN